MCARQTSTRIVVISARRTIVSASPMQRKCNWIHIIVDMQKWCCCCCEWGRFGANASTNIGYVIISSWRLWKSAAVNQYRRLLFICIFIYITFRSLALVVLINILYIFGLLLCMFALRAFGNKFCAPLFGSVCVVWERLSEIDTITCKRVCGTRAEQRLLVFDSIIIKEKKDEERKRSDRCALCALKYSRHTVTKSANTYASAQRKTQRRKNGVDGV